MLFPLFSKKFKFLDQTALPTSKRVVYKFPYELPNNFRHRISGNQEIMEKSQKWVELEPSTKSPLGKKNTLVPVFKNFKKSDIKVSYPVRFCLISWHCFINFVLHCKFVLQGEKNSQK